MTRVVTLGEVLLRLSPMAQTRLLGSKQFDIHYGGSEINVAAALSSFGIDTRVVTKLPDHELGDSAIQALKSVGIDTSFIARGGERIGIYFLENGCSVRPTKVIYDRNHSAFTQVRLDEFDVDAILQGAEIFHVSGITLGISEATFQLAKTFMQRAHELGVKVSFDFNYRSKLWTLEQATAKFKEVLPFVHILFGSHLDFCNLLGQTPIQDLSHANIPQYYQRLYESIATLYQPEYMISSIREVESANRNQYQGLLFHNQQMVHSKTYRLDIVDRVGTGDAFAAGFLYAYLMDKEPQYTIEFATALAAWKHTIPGDMVIAYAQEIDQMIQNGSFAVQR